MSGIKLSFDMGLSSDPDDGVIWDISPGGIGDLDIKNKENNLEGLKNIYNIKGGTILLTPT